MSSHEIIPSDVVAAFVMGAVTNKYAGVDDRRLAEWSLHFLTQYQPLNAEAELRRSLRPVRCGEDDVSNHVILLLLIERYWRHQLPQQPLRSLHAAILGSPEVASSLRVREQVTDYTGPLVPALCTEPLLQELEAQVIHLVPALAGADAQLQGTFLAHLFAGIIRCHPFEDGNGRVARLGMQLCLRAWRRSFITLPKVRNDAAWLTSVSAAVEAHEIGDLRAFFAQRLKASQV